MKRLMMSRLVARFAACLMLACSGWAAAEYVPDPTYNNGLMALDAFSSSATNNYDGRKLIRIGGGDLITAGRVPALTTGTTYGAIGLVRRNSAGDPVTWSDPGAYGVSGNRYVVYPGSANVRIAAVKDLIQWGDNLYVLAETNNGLGSFDATIYVFSVQGNFRSSFIVDSDDGSERTVWGGGLEMINSTTLLYIGRKRVATSPNRERIVFRRFSVSGTGTLTPQTNAIHPAIPECGPTAHCSGFDITSMANGTGGHSLVYIAGSRSVGGVFRSMAVQIDPNTGASTGIGYQEMAQGARGRSIAVEISGENENNIFVVAEKDRACKNGMVVSGRVKNQATGAYATWHRVLGGSDATGALCNLPSHSGSETWPHAIAYGYDSSRSLMGVVGHRIGAALCLPGQACETPVDGVIAVLNARDGTEISPLRTYPYSASVGGARSRHSSFRSIFSAAPGDGAFSVGGEVSFLNSHANPDLRGKRQFASLRVYNSGTDIFSNGFESAGGGQPQPSWLYAPQYATNTIKVFHSSGGNYSLVNTASLPAGTKPNALAFDNTGKLWVVGEDRRLLRYSREHMTTQASPVPEVTVNPYPAGGGAYFQMAFWGNNAYISNSDFGGTNRVLRFPLATLNAGGNAVPSQTYSHATFVTPAGLAFDAQGKLWVSNYSYNSPAHRISRLNVGNNTIERVINSINHNGNPSISQAEGMAFNATGDLFVGNNGRPSYARYNAATLNGANEAPAPTHLQVMSPETTPPAGHTGYIGGMAMDANGNLWFNYQRENQIRQYRPDNTAGQAINNATTDPGFGGIAFWPVPAMLHRGQ